MNPDRVRITIDEHGVAEVAMTRVEKLNALDAPMFAALDEAIARLGRESGLRAVVLHGEGRAFCSGIDLGRLKDRDPGPTSTETAFTNLIPRTRGLANAYQQVAWGWRELAVPVIAAVHGTAFGGGLQIALGADLRIVAPDTRIAVMEVRWGLVPDMAGCALLASLVRDDVFRDLVYSGRIVDGNEALRIGLATRVAVNPLGEARSEARAIASRSPDAVRAAKRLCNLANAGAAQALLLAEAREQQRLLGSPNQTEAVQAGMEKRPPRFRDAQS